MLPSTGLFRSIVCPYYEISGCTRPYCHFKHVRKDEELDQSKPAVYTPTPTSAPTFLTLCEPVKKKTKLEYTPTEPAINDAPRKHDYAPKSSEIPVYIPSNAASIAFATPQHTVSEVIDLDDYHDDGVPSPPQFAEASTASDSTMTSKNEDNNVEEATEPVFLEEAPSKTEDDSSKKRESPPKEKSRRHSSSRSHSSAHKTNRSSSSPSSSSRHKGKSSRSKESNHKTRDREKDSDRHSSKSSSHRSESRKSSSSSQTKTSSRTESSNKKASDKSRNSSSREKSSSSSSHKKRSRSKERTSSHSKSSRKKTDKVAPIEDVEPVYDSTSDEDDIMQQCKMIFEEYSSQTIVEEKKPDPVTIAKPDDDKYEDASKKKWLAHEKSSNSKPLIQPPARKPNHVQNAMQSIIRRQEIFRQQKEAEAAREAEELAAKKAAEAAAAAKKAAEAAKLKEESSLTPLIPRNYLTPSKSSGRSIAPVSNILALERAKKKVEMLRAQKQITPCQTVSKVAGRTAHSNSAMVDNSRPAPPVLEANSTKISCNLRTQYYNMMVNHCLNIYPACEDAWDRAQTEELTVFKKCNTPVIYKSSALLAINKLRKESIEAGNVCTDKNKTISHEVILAGKLGQNTSWSVNKKKKIEGASSSAESIDKIPSAKAYELVYECCLTEEQLVSNGYPRPGAKPGTAIAIATRQQVRPPSEFERYCSRCSKLFNLTIYDQKSTDECNYHPKSTGYRRGFADNSHRCCQQPAGTPGCTYADYHISDYVDYDNLTGFVKTIDRDESYIPTRNDIFALDCEMCYTTMGMELTRITVVDIHSKTVYDALVKPDNKIVDYNTTYSGITESMLENEKRTLRDIQAILLSMFHSKTILIGHSLESDMKALKLIHSVVVDTSVLFPHKMGPPKKRALKTLCIENLKRIIQENEHGHDSAEDAEVCIQLVKYYLRNRIV